MKRKIKKIHRSFMQSVVSTLSLIAFTTAVLLVVALVAQDIIGQLWIAEASDKINSYNNQQLSVLTAENGQLRNRFNDVVSELYSEKEAKDWNKFIELARSLAPIYDFPLNVLVSQAALESARGKSHFAIERNNYFGYNCNDGKEEKDCAWFATPAESIIEYMRLIKRNYKDAYAVRHNPELMIQKIREGGYATDTNYVAKVTHMQEWEIK